MLTRFGDRVLEPCCRLPLRSGLSSLEHWLRIPPHSTVFKAERVDTEGGPLTGDRDETRASGLLVRRMTQGAQGPKEATTMRAMTSETEDRSWQDYANCLGVDPDLFFPERGASTREAKEVCRGCVVRDQCLEYALANGEKFGIWGGLSERERRRIRRQRALGLRRTATA